MIQTSSGGAASATAPAGALIALAASSTHWDDPARSTETNVAYARDAGLALELPPTLVETLARRAAEIVAEQNAGFLDAKGAAQFLGGCSLKRIYNLVERDAIPYYKPHGRLLFDPRELREWVTEEGRRERS
jgi:hypothetical protein